MKHISSSKVNSSANVPLKYEFVIENDYTPYIIENGVFLTYSDIVMNRDSDSWLETIISKINTLNINYVQTMVEIPMGMTQQVAVRDIYLIFAIAIYLEILSLMVGQKHL